MTAPRDWAKDRETCAKATPGPWLHMNIEGAAYEGKVIAVPPDQDHGICEIAQMPEADDRQDDFNFIAEARLGWPAALDEIEQLQLLIDGFAKAYAAWNDETERAERYGNWESHKLHVNGVAYRHATDALLAAARKPEGS